MNENDATEEENSKTSSGEHTVIPNPSAVTSTPDSEQKPIQNGSSDFDSTPIKSSTPVNPVKPPAPTEVINPMTFSIMPASVPHLAHTPENNRKTETTSSKPSDPMSLLQDEGDMSGSSNYPANVRAQPSGVEMSSASDNEPVADLMMFSLTPSAMARIRSTPVFCSPGQGQVMHTSPASQPDLSKVNEVTQSTNEDLIEFSINPNFVRNAHSSSKGPYDFSTTNRGSRSLSSSPHPPRAKSPGMHSPELHTSRRSPEPSSRYLLTTDQQQKNSPQDQEKNQEIKNATNFATIGEPQSAQKTPTPPFQRQTSFPFQNKQPAVLESKTDVHALPQSSDFANRFPTLDDGEDDSRGDLLKPDWKHFAENENASSSEFFSTSPERWTVLSATGEEEATFKPERQFSEDFVSTTTTSISESDERTASSEATSEEIKHTPAITSLKRVANYAPEKPAKPVSPVAGRPLPSVPYGDSATSQPTTLPLSYNDRGLPTSLGSPMAHLSPNSSTAKFLAHPNHGSNAISSSTSRSAAPPNTTKPASKTKYDPEYADPDDLVFCKPNSSQQWSAHTGSLYGQKRQDVASKSNAQGGRNGSDDHEYFVEVETVTYKSNAKSAEQPGSARESSKNEEFSGDIKSGSDGRKDGSGGSAADRNSEFSSPPISADPLYALPEKLKIKFATQGATTSASSTTAENRTTPVETPLSSVASASSISSVTAASSTGGQRPSKPAASTGAEYLTLLLQERQSARQQTSANLTTPTGDLLEASTKARAGSNIDLSPTTVRDGTISIGGSIVSTASLKTRHRSGKEYLAELLQRRAKQQSVEQSSNAGLHVAGQTPKYPMSNSSNVHASPSGALGSNPRHTVASESRVSASQPAHTEKQSSSTGKVRSTVQPLYHGSNPVGPGSHSSSGGVSSGRHVGASNVQRVDRVTDTGAHKTTSEATSQRQFAAQKRTQGPASKGFSILSLSVSLSLSLSLSLLSSPLLSLPPPILPSSPFHYNTPS